ncbi:MAG: hypothetical protein C0611_07985, partial [Desulfobacteraceae bacterium]
LLAEDKQNIAKKASDERANISDPNQIQTADPNGLGVSDPNEGAAEPSPSEDPNLLAGSEGEMSRNCWPTKWASACCHVLVR